MIFSTRPSYALACCNSRAISLHHAFQKGSHEICIYPPFPEFILDAHYIEYIMSCDSSGSVKKRRTTDFVSTVKVLVTELEELIEVLNRELNKCYDGIVNYRDILQSKVRQLGRGIGLYARCFQELAVANREEMDRLFKDHFSHKEIREAMDDLLACEDRWNNLLERMEKHVNTHDSKPKTVSKVPLDTVIYEGDKESNLGLVSESKKRLILILLRHLA